MSSVNHDDFAHLKIPLEDVISATNNFAKEPHLEQQKLRKSSLNNKFAHLRIPLEYIISTTNNFADKNLTNTGGIGNRYKGQLLWSGELIDIIAQRLNKDLQYGEQMFWTEISMLSSLKHKNLVSLVGFCDENDEKIIITRYDTRGILSEYLSDPMLLTWERRLKICVGVAHALSYIFYDEPRDFSVIHRCLCSATVRLNDEWEPTLSDFQCSMKIKASERHHSFHTNKLEYFNGYGDPTYIETNSVSHKSDIYSFGIVLFELLCGREAVTNVDQDNKYFASVAVTHCREKKLNEIIDWDLRNQMDSQSFNIFAETAYDSLNEKQSQRPNIEEIVTRLEKALELQLEHQKAPGTEDYGYRYFMWNDVFQQKYFSQGSSLTQCSNCETKDNMINMLETRNKMLLSQNNMLKARIKTLEASLELARNSVDHACQSSGILYDLIDDINNLHVE